jgi:hypothetical protein
MVVQGDDEFEEGIVKRMKEIKQFLRGIELPRRSKYVPDI